MDNYGYFYRPTVQDYTVCEEFYNCTGEDLSCDELQNLFYQTTPNLWSYGSDVCSPPCAYPYVPTAATPPPPLPQCPPPYRPPPCRAAVAQPVCVVQKEVKCITEQRVEPCVLPTIYKKPAHLPGRPTLIAEYVDVMEPCGARRVYTKTFTSDDCDDLISLSHRRRRHRSSAPRRKPRTRIVYVERERPAAVTTSSSNTVIHHPADVPPCCQGCSGSSSSGCNHQPSYSRNQHPRHQPRLNHDHDEYHVYENEEPPPPPPPCHQSNKHSYRTTRRKCCNNSSSYSARHCPCPCDY
jgi:hypothetical protein